MGCDIHMVLERQAVVKGELKWVGVHAFPYLQEAITSYDEGERPYHFWRAKSRNYALFAELAGVRGAGHIEDARPLGFPDDASELSVVERDAWGADGHSHSHLSVEDFAKRYIIAESGPQALVAERLEGGSSLVYDTVTKLFGDLNDAGNPAPHRVVFWFDN